jgi:hypothetical protein
MSSLVLVLGPRLIFGWCVSGRYIPGTEMGIKTGIMSGPYWVDSGYQVTTWCKVIPAW